MLYKREKLLRTICNSLTWIKTVCELESLLHLFNIHTISEHFFCRFLNEAYDLSLIDLNKVTQNYPALDLGDAAKRMAFQVTSNGNRTKIQSTLDRCDPNYKTKNGNQPKISIKDYDHIRFIVFGKKQKRYTTLKWNPKLTFDPQKDILDIKDLVKHADSLTTPKLNALVQIISQELTVGSGIESAIPHTDQQALEVYRRHFDSPFMQDNWRDERNYERFQLQCEEAVSVLNSGVLDSQTVTKSRHDFDDSPTGDALENVYHLLRDLLAEFRKRTISKGGAPPEIDIHNNSANFECEATYDLFNAKRQEITDRMNAVFLQHGMKIIRGVLR
ncbi:MAG: hypothetical protein CME33_04340 [Gimesia sp.]|uniref:SMEK domain-containing protein n=1 Tax=Gimesia sp. TaxID=2024833 RepID=UPI000C484929|nr:SMEK domain-containing protein [Gimesia sp.]MAX35782.1 hypothetical protein [Gimesia sp.]|tara:strand:+ start:13726 stop:14718 length:993 start_codon:yes stop_codon:yes gene_type:complete